MTDLDLVARLAKEAGLPPSLTAHPGFKHYQRLVLRELGARQAQIDRLMLEYCPDEMTPEQLAAWGKHQRPGRLSLEKLADLHKDAPDEAEVCGR